MSATAAGPALPRLLNQLAAGGSTDTLLQQVAEEGARTMDPATSMCAVVLGGGATELAVRARAELSDTPTPAPLLLTGPVRTTATTGATTMVTDLDDGGGRWPTWAALARQSGFRGVRCWPVRVAASPIGALAVLTTNPWSTPSPTEPGGPRSSSAGQALADVCAVILQLPGPSQRWAQVVSNVQAATGRDVVVHQAVGMIAAAHEVDIPTAATALAAHATQAGVEAVELAHQVVGREVRPQDVALP